MPTAGVNRQQGTPEIDFCSSLTEGPAPIQTSDSVQVRHPPG